MKKVVLFGAVLLTGTFLSAQDIVGAVGKTKGKIQFDRHPQKTASFPFFGNRINQFAVTTIKVHEKQNTQLPSISLD